MFLRELEIFNWHCIKKTRLLCHELMVLIGPANQGKSSVIAAIMSFLEYRKIENKDHNDDNSPIEIMGIFNNIDKEIYREFNSYVLEDTLSIKIVKNKNEEINYLIFTKDRKWVDLPHETYKKILLSIEVIFIPDFGTLEDYKKIGTSFVKVLNKNEYDVSQLIEHITKTYEYLKDIHASKGMHRKILFEVFKVLIESTKKSGKNLLGNTLLFFEEPELYQHPQACKELYYILNELTKLGSQFFITTHSSSFVSLKHYKSIAIVRNDEDKGSVITQFAGNLFSGDEVQDFNMNYWINPDRSELFFAKKVILVEGQTDKIVLSSLAEKLNVYKYEYSIIECGSKSIIPQFMKLLNYFRIPYIAVYDMDQHDWRTPEEKENSFQKNKTIKKSVNPSFGASLGFENDIEEEIYDEKRERKNYKNKPFYALQTVMDKTYVIPERLERKIREIFKEV